jgi:hypothetical protein
MEGGEITLPLYVMCENKIIKALFFYIYALRYRRTEGWDDTDPTNQHFIQMINKYWEAR